MEEARHQYLQLKINISYLEKPHVMVKIHEKIQEGTVMRIIYEQIYDRFNTNKKH